MPSTVYKKVNLDSVRTRGAEVRMNLRPYDPWSLELEVGYTYLDTDVNDRARPTLKQLPNEPNNVVDARLFFVIPRALTSFAFSAQWRDRAIIENSGTGSPRLRRRHHALRPRLPPRPAHRAAAPEVDGTSRCTWTPGTSRTRAIIDSYAVRGRTFFVGVRANWNPKAPPAWFSKLGLGGGPT